MITVAQLSESIVRRSPFLEEGLFLGLINLTALARKIQPEIQEKLFKDIKLGAIVMALKRLQDQLPQKHSQSVQIANHLGDLTVRSSLVEFTYSNSESLVDKQAKLYHYLSGNPRLFLTSTQGVLQTGIIASKALEEKISEFFTGEKLQAKFENLSSITINLPDDNIETPGVYYQILKKLAWEGINIMEAISTFTELTIVLENSQVDKAFSVLKAT